MKNICMWCSKAHPEKQIDCPQMSKDSSMTWEGSVRLGNSAVWVHADARWGWDTYGRHKVVEVKWIKAYDNEGREVTTPQGFTTRVAEIIQDEWESK